MAHTLVNAQKNRQLQWRWFQQSNDNFNDSGSPKNPYQLQNESENR